MNMVATVTQKQLMDFLLNVAVVRPVCAGDRQVSYRPNLRRAGWPGMCIAARQPAGPRRPDRHAADPGRHQPFLPAEGHRRQEAYYLFLDELNACSHEVQKAFYSLIHERRIGEYYLPDGSIVVGAGKRAQDSAIVRPMSSALLNRMLHVHLTVSHRDWLEWAYENGIHQLVIEHGLAR